MQDDFIFYFLSQDEGRSKWLEVKPETKADENITEIDYAASKRIKSPDFYR